MHVSFRCPSCERTAGCEAGPGDSQLRCGRCGWSKPLRTEDIAPGAPRRCLFCGCNDLWRQKDFPQRVGLAIVALGIVLSTVAWFYMEPLWSLGILMVFALADMLLYVFMRDVLVCYRCGARYSQATVEERPYFDLEVAERYRQEARRIAEPRE